MGHYKDSQDISCYTPDDDSNHLYIEANNINMDDLLRQINDHFGKDIDMSTLNLQAEHIHTRCLGYDLYDPIDYTNYICIQKIK